MRDRARLTLALSDDLAKRVEEIAANNTRTNSSKLREALTLQQLLDTAPRDIPCLFSVGDGWEISNAAFRDQVVASPEFDALMREKPAKPKRSLGKLMWDAVEIKPGIAGIRIDLKKVMQAMFERDGDASQ